MEDLGVAVVDAVVFLFVGADERLLEHKALAGITARHHIDSGGVEVGQGHLLLVLIIGLKGIHRGALVGVGQERLGSEGDGSSSRESSSRRRDRKRREGLGIKAVNGYNGSSGSCADRAGVDSLNVVARLLLGDRDILANQAGDIGKDRSSRCGQIGSQLGRLDVRDQEGQELLLGGRERRREQ
jgi:hypothetical protein